MSEQIHLENLKEKAESAKVTELPVHKFMKSKVIVIHEGSKIHSAVTTLINHNISGAPVVDKSNHLIGVITEYDLLLQTATKDVSGPITFTSPVESVEMDTPLNKLLVLFYKKKYRWVPVVGRNKTVEGIVTRMDVLNQLIKQ